MKVLARKMKESEEGNGGGGDVIWMGNGERFGAAGRSKSTGNVAAENTPSRPSSGAAEKKTVAAEAKRLRGKISSLKKEVEEMKDVLHRELGSSKAVEDALKKGSNSDWKGRQERIRLLEDQVVSLKAMLASSTGEGNASVPSSRGSGDTGLTGGARDAKLAEYRLRCQVAEVRMAFSAYLHHSTLLQVERDRLTEYVKVVSQRADEAEAMASRAESALRSVSTLTRQSMSNYGV